MKPRLISQPVPATKSPATTPAKPVVLASSSAAAKPARPEAAAVAAKGPDEQALRKQFYASLQATLTGEQKGLLIATESERRDNGFGDHSSDMTMTLRNQHGDEVTRYLRINTLEVVGDGDKSLTIFDRPADIKGTALLTFSHKKGPDDQWLYLPALKRVKRISSGNKSGAFMGSEFAYEDLSSQEVEKYTYKFSRI